MLKSIRHIGFIIYNKEVILNFYQKLGFVVLNGGLLKGEESKHCFGEECKLEWIKLKLKNENILLEFWYFLDPKLVFDETNLSSHHISFTVNNIDEFYNKYQETIHFENKPILSENKKVKLCFCQDPEGNIIEIVEEL